MEGLKKDTRKIKYFLMKTLRTTRTTTCRTFSILAYSRALLITTVKHFTAMALVYATRAYILRRGINTAVSEMIFNLKNKRSIFN